MFFYRKISLVIVIMAVLSALVFGSALAQNSDDLNIPGTANFVLKEYQPNNCINAANNTEYQVFYLSQEARILINGVYETHVSGETFCLRSTTDPEDLRAELPEGWAAPLLVTDAEAEVFMARQDLFDYLNTCKVKYDPLSYFPAGRDGNTGKYSFAYIALLNNEGIWVLSGWYAPLATSECPSDDGKIPGTNSVEFLTTDSTPPAVLVSANDAVYTNNTDGQIRFIRHGAFLETLNNDLSRSLRLSGDGSGDVVQIPMSMMPSSGFNEVTVYNVDGGLIPYSTMKAYPNQPDWLAYIQMDKDYTEVVICFGDFNCFRVSAGIG